MSETYHLWVVIGLESEVPELLGTYTGSHEDYIEYEDTSGETHRAPHDCVTVRNVSIQQ